MKFEIKHRYNGSILFECEAGSMRLAVELAVGKSANLQFANLQFADLRFANLRSADLQFADLRSADLQSANLRSANLRSADLRSADLRSADLQFAVNVLCLPVGDARGYRPFAVWQKDKWRILSGCRDFTIAQARKHWGAKSYGDSILGAQYVAACDWLESQPAPVAEAKAESKMITGTKSRYDQIRDVAREIHRLTAERDIYVRGTDEWIDLDTQARNLEASIDDLAENSSTAILVRNGYMPE